ncbi:hypothetical protein K502DRAFT_95564 [Neoconidiobolus thromboides FSU 785]|nr:hypothetical protein K502DRAFT_95564 [Neoconidiobolus thromboides FSU 785]
MRRDNYRGDYKHEDEDRFHYSIHGNDSHSASRYEKNDSNIVPRRNLRGYEDENENLYHSKNYDNPMNFQRNTRNEYSRQNNFESLKSQRSDTRRFNDNEDYENRLNHYDKYDNGSNRNKNNNYERPDRGYNSRQYGYDGREDPRGYIYNSRNDDYSPRSNNSNIFIFL